MGGRLGPSVVIFNVISLFFWILAWINMTSKWSLENYRKGSLTKQLKLLWLICKRPSGLLSCTFCCWHLRRNTAMQGEAVRIPLIWIWYRVRFEVQKPAVRKPFWYAVTEESSREQTRVQKGFTVTPSGQAETLQPFYYAVRKVQGIFRSIWNGDSVLSGAITIMLSILTNSIVCWLYLISSFHSTGSDGSCCDRGEEEDFPC